MKKCLRVLPALYDKLHHDVQSAYSQNLTVTVTVTKVTAPRTQIYLIVKLTFHLIY